MGYDNDLAPTRWQAITMIWTSDGYIYNANMPHSASTTYPTNVNQNSYIFEKSDI